ncbi:hypothetical protein [Notoacmeibacter sp. MSK16QG-6]|uniref:hypothetical protein n=1 Tax=Notoacmeibacter sp. MSK16QG-6 TaxID=2957982 RepID=UPI0020A1A68E|nr:hypothetical protein [Notoacmeibacter sp. MSK16QG-6]MCP1199289.1 hypothetical protein [Notoacmeibacter sp. MSK16QG-6]
MSAPYPETPDGRYFVAKGRLWRKSDPHLPEEERQAAVNDLMAARRAVRDARDGDARHAARQRVDAAKRRLGERGPVWWNDDAPDETRKAPWNTSYADWWNALTTEEKAKGNPQR